MGERSCVPPTIRSGLVFRMENRRRSSLKRFIFILDRVVDNIGALAFMGMMLVLCIQIFFRYFLESPVMWATPLAMFLFIWGIWFGGVAGMRDENQIRVEFAEIYLPVRVQRFLLPLLTLLSIGFLILIIVKSPRIIQLQSTAIYDTLPFNRDALFVVVPIAGSLMVIALLRVFLRQIRCFYFAETQLDRTD